MTEILDRLWVLAGRETGAGGHDLDHVRRVYRLAMTLADSFPETDRELLAAAVILHDIARDDEDNDPTGDTDHAELGARRAERILRELGWPPARASAAARCVRCHRYRDRDNAPDSLEARLLYDADKLDCLGAVGVGRLFMLSGQYGERLFIEPPEGFGEDGAAPRIDRFQRYSPNLEYLLKMRHVPAALLTEPAREMAKARMERMDRFFTELREELGL